MYNIRITITDENGQVSIRDLNAFHDEIGDLNIQDEPDQDWVSTAIETFNVQDSEVEVVIEYDRSINRRLAESFVKLLEVVELLPRPPHIQQQIDELRQDFILLSNGGV